MAPVVWNSPHPWQSVTTRWHNMIREVNLFTDLEPAESRVVSWRMESISDWQSQTLVFKCKTCKSQRSSLLIQNPEFGTCVCNLSILDAVAGMNELASVEWIKSSLLSRRSYDAVVTTQALALTEPLYLVASNRVDCHPDASVGIQWDLPWRITSQMLMHGEL